MINKIIERIFSYSSFKASIIWGIIFITLNITLLSFIGPAFEERTNGIKLLDLTVFIKPDQVYPVISSYNQSDITFYFYFSAFDYIFPLVGSIWYSCLTATLLKKLSVSEGHHWSGYLVILPYLTCLLDWLENINYLIIISSFPYKINLLTYIVSVVAHSKVYNLWFTSLVLIVSALFILKNYLFK
jgi:hypothetical protein